jgi:DNA-binding CsgD family transcriptional regulator
MKFLQPFISNLYRNGADMPAEQFQAWAYQELKSLVPFDAALWGTGTVKRGKFHNVTVLGLPSSFATALEQTRQINPLYTAIRSNLGKTIENRDVLSDAEFYKSEVYQRCFSQFGVERILSSAHADLRSGLYTLFSLYRFDRKRLFTEQEKQIHEIAGYHMLEAYSNAFFLHLTRPRTTASNRLAAVVDAEGVPHEVQPGFIDLLERKFPEGMKGLQLPFELRPNGVRYLVDGLCIKVKPMADLFLVKIWEEGPLDTLTEREREVVFGVCRGLSHKEIGRVIGLAPTTVSSHLYRAYKKLNVESRSALARLVHSRRPA